MCRLPAYNRFIDPNVSHFFHAINTQHFTCVDVCYYGIDLGTSIVRFHQSEHSISTTTRSVLSGLFTKISIFIIQIYSLLIGQYIVTNPEFFLYAMSFTVLCCVVNFAIANILAVNENKNKNK